MQSGKKKVIPFEERRKQSSAPQLINKKQVSDPTISSEELLSLWQHEIENLSSQKFSSYQEAVSALITQVMDKIGCSPDSRKDTEDFLRNLLDVDPAVEKEIRSLLNIQGD